MSFKRSTVYLLLIPLLTMSACILTPTPEATKVPAVEAPTKVPENKITKYCHPDGTDVLVSPDEKYCFAHPYGYYSYEKDDEPGAFFIQSGNPTLSTAAGAPEPATLLIPVILKVHHETENDKEDLMPYIGRNAKVDLADLSPWILSKEDAFIAKTHLNNTVIYYIYTKHKKEFYTLEFSTGASLSDEGACADELEKLFFTVSKTFTFLD